MSENDQEKARAKRQQWEEHNRAKALAKQQQQEAHIADKAGAIQQARRFQAIKGTRDLLPPDTILWNRAEQLARSVFETFGFAEIRPPIFEQTRMFARTIGLDTDVVSKEMYSFEDHDLPELARLRTILSFEALSFGVPPKFLGMGGGDLSRFEGFAARIEMFVRGLQQGIEEERVGRTPENERFLKSIPGQVTKARNSQQRVDSVFLGDSERDEYTRRLEVSIREIRTMLSDVFLGDEVALRPEATASVCRAYIEHNMQQLPQPVKLYYMGPMFRRERPQKGRYRQFYQIGAEVLGGGDAPGIDAEVIEMVMTFFDRLGLTGAELDINSIGHNAPECRPAYVQELKAELEKVKDKLGADSQRRIETNPLRVLDSKLEHEQAIIATLPRIADHLCDECAAHYAAVKRQLELRGVFFKENWRLVRGLDYYMRTTFEITAKGLGSQNAVCGGGRYDGLVELLGGPPTKGIGFAIGEDRLILSLQESGKGAAPQGRDVYVAWMGERASATAVRAAKDLRNAGFSVELPPTELKFGKALERADKLGSRYALILGDNEVAEGSWTLKTLADGTQQKLTEPELLEYLKKVKSSQ